MRLNCPLVVKVLECFIRDELRKAGFEKIVVGLSGGIDSSLIGKLMKENEESGLKGFNIDYQDYIPPW